MSKLTDLSINEFLIDRCDKALEIEGLGQQSEATEIGGLCYCIIIKFQMFQSGSRSCSQGSWVTAVSVTMSCSLN